MSAQLAINARPHLAPSGFKRGALPGPQLRVLAPGRPRWRIRHGSLAWWSRRLADPEDLIALKVVLTVAVFVIGCLLGP